VDAAASRHAVNLKAMSARHAFIAGKPARTFGYSAPILGPVVRLRSGDEAEMVVENDLDAATTVHWWSLESQPVWSGSGAANAQNFELRFSDQRTFHVVLSEGGFLPAPVAVKKLIISPAERYEVLVDFADRKTVMLETGPDEQMGIFGRVAPDASADYVAIVRFEPAEIILRARCRLDVMSPVARQGPRTMSNISPRCGE
jgi:FtsP/CotA-like multicopper oxidase with cupredoxin domain